MLNLGAVRTSKEWLYTDKTGTAPPLAVNAKATDTEVFAELKAVADAIGNVE